MVMTFSGQVEKSWSEGPQMFIYFKVTYLDYFVEQATKMIRCIDAG